VPEVDLRVYPDPYTQDGIFKGEDIDTFEVGVRTPFLGGKANLTAAIFYNDYRNLQVSAHARPQYQAAVSIAVVNAGSACTYGAEIALTCGLRHRLPSASLAATSMPNTRILPFRRATPCSSPSKFRAAEC
jgi:iron complex outermembrane receptor protein